MFIPGLDRDENEKLTKAKLSFGIDKPIEEKYKREYGLWKNM